jgi:hypothetical protein
MLLLIVLSGWSTYSTPLKETASLGRNMIPSSLAQLYRADPKFRLPPPTLEESQIVG